MPLAQNVAARFQRQAGGADFEHFVQIPDLKRAFREAVEDARHESGHGGYSGTIAEKSDVVPRRREPMSRQEAHKFIQDDIEKNDKHGPAFAVPIGESKILGEKEVVLKVQARDERSAVEAIRKMAGETPSKPGSTTIIKNMGRPVQLKAGKLPELKVDKANDVRFVVNQEGVYRNPILTGASRADVVKSLKAYMIQNPPQAGTVFKVEQWKTLDLITIGVEKALPLWEAKVTLQFVQPGNTIIGWILYGIASS